MGTRSTYKTRKSRCSAYARLTRFPRPILHTCPERWRPISALGADLADPLATTVVQREHLQFGQVAVQPAEERRRGGAERAAAAVVRFQRDAEAISGGAEETLGAALGDPAGERLHQAGVRRAR